MNLVERIGRGSGPEGFSLRCPRKGSIFAFEQGLSLKVLLHSFTHAH